MKRINLALGCLLVPCLWIVPRNEERLVFDPPAGSTLHKEVALEVELRLERVRFDEHEFSLNELAPIRLITSAKFTDEYERVGGGRPLEYVRRFEIVSGKWVYNYVPQEILGFWALSGGAVSFEWHRDKREYTIRRETGTSSLLSLDKLVEDMDLRGLLPVEKVVNGAKWEVRGPSLVDALFGGMELGLVDKSNHGIDLALVRDLLLRPFKELAEKQAVLECKYVESSWPEETRTALVELRHKDRYKLDVTDALNEFLKTDQTAWSGTVSECRLAWAIDGRGTLVWNVTENRYESLDFKADYELEVTIVFKFMLDRLQTLALDSTGSAKWTMRTTSKE